MKANFRNRLLLLFLAIFGNAIGGNGSLARAESNPKPAPAIKYAGILPVYWQGASSPAMSRRKSEIDQVFPKVMRESKRFAFLGDSIVIDNWSSSEGRKKLREEFELDAFLNLNITEHGDIALFTARLLSPELENYVSETDRIPLSWINSANKTELENKIRDLSFRVLNRYPIDVFVTSLQGRFLTLSAGKDQNVFEGDELDFAEFTIKNQHPVDGTWLDFSSKPLGKARIVESKAQSSIAQITSLTSENAIRLGSGARVANIASRRNFRNAEKADEGVFITNENSPIVTLPGQNPPKSKVEKVEPLPPPVQAEGLPEELVQGPMHPAAQGGTSTPESTERGGSGLSDLKNVRFSIEHSSWSYGGAAKAASEMPAILVNQIGGYAEYELDSMTTTMWDLHLTTGDTKNGSYSGGSVGAEYLMAIPSATALIPSLDRVLVGVRAEVATLGVSKETFGGKDSAHLMPVLHAQGNYHIADIVETFAYDISAKLIPLNFGSTGIKGKTQDLGSSLGLDLEAQALRVDKVESIEWGGLIGFRSVSYGLPKKSLDESGFRIGLLGRVKL